MPTSRGEADIVPGSGATVTRNAHQVQSWIQAALRTDHWSAQDANSARLHSSLRRPLRHAGREALRALQRSHGFAADRATHGHCATARRLDTAATWPRAGRVRGRVWSRVAARCRATHAPRASSPRTPRARAFGWDASGLCACGRSEGARGERCPTRPRRWHKRWVLGRRALRLGYVTGRTRADEPPARLRPIRRLAARATGR